MFYRQRRNSLLGNYARCCGLQHFMFFISIVMSPDEFEENCRMVSGDLAWSLAGCDLITPRHARALDAVGGPLPAFAWAVLHMPEWDFDELEESD